MNIYFKYYLPPIDIPIPDQVVPVHISSLHRLYFSCFVNKPNWNSKVNFIRPEDLQII